MADTKTDFTLIRCMQEVPGGIPSHDTINRVFQMLEPDKFHDAFFRWTGAVAGKIVGVVAIDGKTIRRSRDETKGNHPSHMVSAWACEASLVLGQMWVNEKTNEIKAILELLEILCLKGCIVTINAMGAQKEIAEKIIDKGQIISCLGSNQIGHNIAGRFTKEICEYGIQADFRDGHGILETAFLGSSDIGQLQPVVA